jgi:hypothetical protein
MSKWKIVFKSPDGVLREDTYEGADSLAQIESEFAEEYPGCEIGSAVREDIQDIAMANRPEEGWENLDDDGRHVPKRGYGEEYDDGKDHVGGDMALVRSSDPDEDGAVHYIDPRMLKKGEKPLEPTISRSLGSDELGTNDYDHTGGDEDRLPQGELM